MQYDEIVSAMRDAAIQVAYTDPESNSSASTRAAYARGVRAMAGLVHACIQVADEFAVAYGNDHHAAIAFAGYAKGLRHIVSGADELIPNGWE